MFDLLPIGIAFVFGFLVVRIGLPPLVGYLFAGFLLSDLWAEGKETLTVFSEFGITILLFSIGLELKLKGLLRREVLGTAVSHFALSLVIFFYIFAIPFFGLNRIEAIVIALSLTFSSTVYVIKLLEDRGDLRSHYGRLAIGILVIQDIIAVVFLALSANKMPSVWALGLLVGIWPIRIALLRLFSWIQHGELMILFGIVVALVGAFLFDQVNIKGDLGALVFGYLISSHSRAVELKKSLLSFKNFFLLGFFLSIGMYGTPSWEQAGIALLICLALPLRSLFYYFLFNRSDLRSRTSFMGATSLFNYSEFGLIVMAVAVSAGWISTYWVSVLALAITFSYIISAFLNRSAPTLYRRYQPFLSQHEHNVRHPLEKEVSTGEANVLVFGMGRVGRGAYEHLDREPHWTPLGFDFSTDRVDGLKERGFNIQWGDATNPDFWARFHVDASKIKIVLLALPMVNQNVTAAEYLRSQGYQGPISSIAKFPEEIKLLQRAGVNRAFNLYAEAGIGFAGSSNQLVTQPCN